MSNSPMVWVPVAEADAETLTMELKRRVDAAVAHNMDRDEATAHVLARLSPAFRTAAERCGLLEEGGHRTTHAVATTRISSRADVDDQIVALARQRQREDGSLSLTSAIAEVLRDPAHRAVTAAILNRPMMSQERTPVSTATDNLKELARTLQREARESGTPLSDADALSKAATTPIGRELSEQARQDSYAGKAESVAASGAVQASATKRVSQDEVQAAAFKKHVSDLVAGGKTPGDAYAQCQTSYPEQAAAYARWAGRSARSGGRVSGD